MSHEALSGHSCNLPSFPHHPPRFRSRWIQFSAILGGAAPDWHPASAASTALPASADHHSPLIFLQMPISAIVSPRISRAPPPAAPATQPYHCPRRITLSLLLTAAGEEDPTLPLPPPEKKTPSHNRRHNPPLITSPSSALPPPPEKKTLKRLLLAEIRHSSGRLRIRQGRTSTQNRGASAALCR